jgi:hypothetical protein
MSNIAAKHTPERDPWIVQITDSDHRTQRIAECVGPVQCEQVLCVWLQALAPDSAILELVQDFAQRIRFRTREQARRFQKTWGGAMMAPPRPSAQRRV